jgi:hypothetical protein
MCQQRRTSWTREQIRSARRVNLAPLLRRRGFTLLEHSNGNYEIGEHPGIIVKDSYWNRPEHDNCGNTIDFFVDVLGMSFSNAMQEILGQPVGNIPPAIPSHAETPGEDARSERDYSDAKPDQTLVIRSKSVRP